MNSRGGTRARSCARSPTVRGCPRSGRNGGSRACALLLETPDHDHLAYVEGQLTSYLHEDPDDVSVLQQKYGMLRSQALSVDKSARLLDELLGET
ncbi:Scr1 family TA system antitoxin-like transcriptional regulator [Streptomyces sp. NPDC058439]|uniref:Scr1 family TA system antitoxin-like transcriptional regulator n=1 Tax=Streptomyces sp. NPDC058439 TaxID=3346500 RepID=UPI003659566F